MSSLFGVGRSVISTNDTDTYTHTHKSKQQWKEKGNKEGKGSTKRRLDLE